MIVPGMRPIDETDLPILRTDVSPGLNSVGPDDSTRQPEPRHRKSMISTPGDMMPEEHIVSQP